MAERVRSFPLLAGSAYCGKRKEYRIQESVFRKDNQCRDRRVPATAGDSVLSIKNKKNQKHVDKTKAKVKMQKLKVREAAIIIKCTVAYYNTPYNTVISRVRLPACLLAAWLLAGTKREIYKK